MNTTSPTTPGTPPPASEAPDPLEDTGRHPLYKRFEARRSYPRVKLHMPVQIGLPGGRIACARVYNLSPDGLQIRCDGPTAKAIHPSGKPVKQGEEPEVLAVLRTEGGKDMRTHVLKCRMSYMLPQSRTEIIMGLIFQDLLPDQRAAIDALLCASLTPSGVES